MHSWVASWTDGPDLLSSHLSRKGVKGNRHQHRRGQTIVAARHATPRHGKEGEEVRKCGESRSEDSILWPQRGPHHTTPHQQGRLGYFVHGHSVHLCINARRGAAGRAEARWRSSTALCGFNKSRACATAVRGPSEEWTLLKVRRVFMRSRAKHHHG